MVGGYRQTFVVDKSSPYRYNYYVDITHPRFGAVHNPPIRKSGQSGPTRSSCRLGFVVCSTIHMYNTSYGHHITRYRYIICNILHIVFVADMPYLGWYMYTANAVIEGEFCG